MDAVRYPTDTLANARKSAIQCALDANRGLISEQAYKVILAKIHARIKELSDAELAEFTRTRGKS